MTTASEIDGQLTFDFRDGRGPVPAHRHTNPDGGEGGWVSDTAKVSPKAVVGGSAVVDDSRAVLHIATIGTEGLTLYRTEDGYGLRAGCELITIEDALVRPEDPAAVWPELTEEVRDVYTKQWAAALLLCQLRIDEWAAQR